MTNAILRPHHGLYLGLPDAGAEGVAAWAPPLRRPQAGSGSRAGRELRSPVRRALRARGVGRLEWGPV
jgi:hypothetical protein